MPVVRIINGALHLLGGGTLGGFTLPEDQGRKRVRVRAVLWAPAVDRCWLWPGQYHGKAGFDNFTHYRSVLTRSTRFDAGYAYPPARSSLKTMKRAYRLLFRS